MIRIVHILTSFDIGGAEQFALDLCRRLDRKRFDVRVIGIVRGGPLRAEFHEAGIPTDVVGKRTRLGREVIRHLTADLRSPTPDIVHTQLFGGDTWGRIAAIRAGVPHIVSTEQNTNLDEGAVKRAIKRRLARRTDRIVAISDAVRSYSVRVDRIPLEKFVVIPNGVDLDVYRPAPATPHEGIRFLTVARHVPQKGLDVLLDAFAIVRARLPRATLDLVGDGPLRGALEDQVRTFGLTDAVHVRGFERTFASAYQRADIFVLPSRWEGLGIAAIEAAACGLPTVASDVGGLREVVADGETGILVPPSDPKPLADAMLALAADRPRRALMGHAARRRAERTFDIAAIVRRYEDLYASLVGRTASGRYGA